MKSLIILLTFLTMLAGCAISGRGNFPHPVWIWECWMDKTLCD